jgi:hypothetical protein
MTDKSELAAVKAELAAIKAQLNPKPPPTEADVAAHRDRMREMSEARVAAFNPYSRDQLAAMQKASPNTQAIVHDQRGAPTGPSTIIPSTGSGVRGPIVASGSGWSNPTPLRNGLGQGNWTDNAAFAPDRDRLKERAEAADLARKGKEPT